VVLAVHSQKSTSSALPTAPKSCFHCNFTWHGQRQESFCLPFFRSSESDRCLLALTLSIGTIHSRPVQDGSAGRSNMSAALFAQSTSASLSMIPYNSRRRAAALRRTARTRRKFLWPREFIFEPNVSRNRRRSRCYDYGQKLSCVPKGIGHRCQWFCKCSAKASGSGRLLGTPLRIRPDRRKAHQPRRKCR